MDKQIEQFPSPRALDTLAEKWDLSDITFVRKMENIVFSCQSPSGKVYLRLTTPLRRKKPEILAEIQWIEHLAKSGLHVPKIISDKEGQKVVSITDGTQHYEAVVFSEIKGEHPKEETVITPQFLQKLGAIMGKMHEASIGYPRSFREEWSHERGIRHALEAAKISNDKRLSTQFKKAIAWIESLPRNATNYGLVHADLGALNMFIGDDETIGIIDFDDSCYHWFAFDLAIILFSMAGRFKQAKFGPTEAQWLTHLLIGYRKIRSFSEEEVHWIPRFITFAALRLFFWIESHQILGTFHEDAVEKVARIKEWVKKWAENSNDF